MYLNMDALISTYFAITLKAVDSLVFSIENVRICIHRRIYTYLSIV